jgi:cytochrome c-type biogenesis protein
MSGGVGNLVQSGPLLLAVPIAAAAGAITFLSPCCLPLVPGFLSYVTGMSGTDAQRKTSAPDGGRDRDGATVAAVAVGANRGGSTPSSAGTGEASAAAAGTAAAETGTAATAVRRPTRGRTVAGTALFVLGFSALFTTYGVAAGGLGAALRTHQQGLDQVLGALTIVLGLLFAGVFERFPITGFVARPSFRPRAGLAGAPLLGIMFGLGWLPCTGPTLTVVLQLGMTTGTVLRGGVLAFIYALGLGIPFLIVAVGFQRGVAAFGFARRHARLITRIGGLMLVTVGVLEVTGAWASAIIWLQVHWSGYTLPL